MKCRPLAAALAKLDSPRWGSPTTVHICQVDDKVRVRAGWPDCSIECAVTDAYRPEQPGLLTLAELREGCRADPIPCEEPPWLARLDTCSPPLTKTTAAEVRGALRAVSYCMGPDHGGVRLLVGPAGEVSAHATDGHRLAVSGPERPYEVCAPQSAVRALMAMLSKLAPGAQLYAAAGWVVVPGVGLTVAFEPSTPPPVLRLLGTVDLDIPRPRTRTVLGAEGVSAAQYLETWKSIADGPKSIVDGSEQVDHYYLRTDTDGELVAALGSRCSPDDVAVAAKYFHEAVGQFGNASAHEVRVTFGSPTDPVYFRRGDAIAVVMPVRV